LTAGNENHIEPSKRKRFLRVGKARDVKGFKIGGCKTRGNRGRPGWLFFNKKKSGRTHMALSIMSNMDEKNLPVTRS
jgi:hypothetical protein